MATRFELVLAGDDPVRLRAAGEAALDEIRYWHDRLSFFEPASFVSHINARACAQPVVCDPDFFSLLALCQAVWTASGGAFDPAIAGLMRAAGFRDAPRDPEALTRLAAAGGFAQVQLDHGLRTIRFLHPSVALDFGAVGKGFALDRAAAVLRESGVACFFLHGGASSVIAGTPPPPPPSPPPPSPPASAPGWPVALTDAPSAPVVHLADAALGVSRPSGRTIAASEPGGPSGPALGHVLDPRTGASASGLAVAAVLGPSAALCDAWSTALLVLTSPPPPPALPVEYSCITAAPDPDHDGRFTWRTAGPQSSTLFHAPESPGAPGTPGTPGATG